MIVSLGRSDKISYHTWSRACGNGSCIVSLSRASKAKLLNSLVPFTSNLRFPFDFFRDRASVLGEARGRRDGLCGLLSVAFGAGFIAAIRADLRSFRVSPLSIDGAAFLFILSLSRWSKCTATNVRLWCV